METRIAVVARDKNMFNELCTQINDRKELKLDFKNPEILVSCGGDGTLLFAERSYPGIPKLILRHNSICKKCEFVDHEEALNIIIKKQYQLKSYPKIDVLIKTRRGEIRRIATNDVIIRNILPYKALRFKVKIKDQINKEFIGDGVVVASAFGSTGYFHSITRKNFTTGIGIAFNNTTEPQHPFFLNNQEIEIEITRDEAHLTTDNYEKIFTLHEGDKIFLRKSEYTLKVIKMRD